MNQNYSVTARDLAAFRQEFLNDTGKRAACRAASKTALKDLCYDLPHASAMNHKFSIDIKTLPATNQKSSGRCWIFAAMNLLREKVAKDLKLEDFQLSQNYIAFYDHLEKANTFYAHILNTADLPLEDRYVSKLLSEPVGDGGWWEYFVGLCNKYGLVPQEAMPDTYQSCHTEQMNTLLNMQLRRDARDLRQAAAKGLKPEDLEAMKTGMLSKVFGFLAVCLGNPPEHFDFEYVDQDRAYHASRNMTPRSFYDTYLGEDLDSIVSILNAPIDLVPYYTTCYTEGEESIFGSHQSKRLNLPLDAFKAAVIRQLEAGEPVWFVCDCDYFGSRQEGIWDTGLYNYQDLFSLDLPMEKGDLLNYRQCSLNHAMVLTGVNLVDGKPDKWKIQNSWGEDTANKGYFIMSDAWFDRFVFTASIRRTYLTEQENAAFDLPPKVLDPYNVLA